MPCSQASVARSLGVSLRTIQRWKKRQDLSDLRRGPLNHPRSLSQQERDQILSVTLSPEYCDMSPMQIVPRLADRGIYLGSESTFYRILRSQKLLAHRRRSARPQRRTRPQGTAYGPNQIWCWDVTNLRGPRVGEHFKLHLFIDIFSRKIVSWGLNRKEDDRFAMSLLTAALKSESITGKGLQVHSDNGKIMKSAFTIMTMDSIGIVRTHSRSGVSDDNPFVEAFFRFMKYRASYPAVNFKTIDQAKVWVKSFVNWYNNVYLHGSIGFLTPASRHEGRSEEILGHRRKLYACSMAKHPMRWTRAQRTWEVTNKVSIVPSG